MAERLRFLPAGSDALLVELDDLETTLALLDAFQDDRPDGVVELVPAARTLLVRFDANVTNRLALVDAIACIDLSTKSSRHGETFEIPLTYDGEDLNDVAELLGWSVEELIRRHTEATYTVAFTGFAPGFAYMTSDDPAFDVPRRKSPRVRIPAGSVALGGKFGGIYPTDSPGGWQLLGRTPLKMWDTSRSRAALLAPGDRVRFCDMAKGASVTVSGMPAASEASTPASSKAEGLLVTRADRPALFQDFGRAGQAGQGVSESGALDRRSLIEANLGVGNPCGSAVIEIAYGGFAIKADRPVTLAVIGPRTDWFTDKGLTTLLAQEWQVTAESSRVGVRLAGAEPLERTDSSELASEGTPLGAIQIPHSGQPVLFLADHPLTGGYPVIGVGAAHYLDLAGQIPIGATIRFNAFAPFDPLLRDTAP
ncbi:urea amidolyase family protein [Rhizobium mongolense]|uniref:KipI family sensor histidine kinase inhibitor n=2 Tax=Rhizobium mongolense TaxID=57676 RepID=A0ABR6IXX0_9HYPH|nr:urea amidolyase family protein [Rhizobium mongolense]MBB4232603.1 KipI family sensor histidine kinase inhibitor [Rhizobium mongolense]TVZ74978.1 KipI family sensor histidine kinase inhibitor [Rhizobium mongolense USDA 1844]